MQNYIVLVKGKYRNEIPKDWIEEVEKIDNVKIVARQDDRLGIETNEEGANKIAGLCDGMLYVEPKVSYFASF